jgi:DNA-binding NarL/FixJ family response regulator
MHAGEEARSESGAARVVLAMPETLVAESLARVFVEAGLLVVGCYSSPRALLEKLERCQPHLLVLDPMIEARDGGSQTLESVRTARPTTHVAVITGDVDAKLVRALVRYGVRGVILRSGPASDAISVVRQVLDGQVVFPSSVMDEFVTRDETGPLSERQREVLEHLAAGRSNEEIARLLYISRNTVKFHLRVIYERLGVRNRVEAARCLRD